MIRSPLVHFLLVGVVLFLGRLVWQAKGEPAFVDVSRRAIEAAVEDYRQQVRRPLEAREKQAIESQRIEERLWLEQALSLGLHEADPVVRQRLLQNMRFLEPQSASDEEALLAQAFALEMHRSDPVVRGRLIERVQALLRAGVRSRPPDRDALEDFYAANPERWRAPPQLDFSHVFLSGDKRGEAIEADAVELLELLVDRGIAGDAAMAYGDPTLSGHRMRGATPNRITARFGPEFAAEIEGVETSRWVGPLKSAFGRHLVFVHERSESRVPVFDAIRDRVQESWFKEQEREAIRAAIERHRENVTLRFIE